MEHLKDASGSRCRPTKSLRSEWFFKALLRIFQVAELSLILIPCLFLIKNEVAAALYRIFDALASKDILLCSCRKNDRGGSISHHPQWKGRG